MKSPFPGMDPYLEHHALWPDVHNRLIALISDSIVPQIAPQYYVRLESRAYVVTPEREKFVGRPDVAIASPFGRLPSDSGTKMVTNDADVLEVEIALPDEINHHYLEIRSTQTHELITLIEVLSPVNKSDASGRRTYLQKRDEVLLSLTNYIEIDLLRGGEPMPLVDTVVSDYRVLVRRGWVAHYAKLYAFNLPATIPNIPLPLLPDDDEANIPLNELVHDVYTRARFDLQIDYTQPPEPALAQTQAEWAATLLSNTR